MGRVQMSWRVPKFESWRVVSYKLDGKRGFTINFVSGHRMQFIGGYMHVDQHFENVLGDLATKQRFVELMIKLRVPLNTNIELGDLLDRSFLSWF